MKCYRCENELVEDLVQERRVTRREGLLTHYINVWVCNSRMECKVRARKREQKEEFDYAKQRVIEAQKELRIAKTELARLLGKVPKGK